METIGAIIFAALMATVSLQLIVRLFIYFGVIHSLLIKCPIHSYSDKSSHHLIYDLCLSLSLSLARSFSFI